MFELAIDLLAQVRFEQPRNFALLDLDSRHIAVIPHPRDPEAGIVEQLLAARDLVEALERDFGAIGESR